MDDVRLCLIAKQAVEKIDHSPLRAVGVQRHTNGKYAADLSALGYVPENVSKVDISAERWKYAVFLLARNGYVVKVVRDDGMTYFGF